MLNFLQPLTDSLKTIYSQGIEVTSPDIARTFISKGILLGSSFDLPAKATVLNMIQYNSEYGCTHCLQSGQRVATTRGGSVRVFSYQCSSPMSRDHHDLILIYYMMQKKQ